MTQQDLFNNGPRALGEVGAQACAEKAERTTGFDTNGARSRAIEILSFGPMSGEDLVDALKRAGFSPHDDRAFGAVFGWLARHNKIRCVGYCARKRGHGTAGGRVWAVA